MIVFIFVSAMWFLSEILLSKILKSNKPDNNLDKSSLKIMWITIIVSIILGIFLRRQQIAAITENSIVLYYSGLTCIVLGLAIRWVAIFTLKKDFTVNVNISENQQLVQSGLYKYIRHPAYLGSLLSFLGLGLVFNNWITLLVIFIPIFFAFNYRIKVEESVLLKAFGEQYSNYMDKTWKVMPGIF